MVPRLFAHLPAQAVAAQLMGLCEPIHAFQGTQGQTQQAHAVPAHGVILVRNARSSAAALNQFVQAPAQAVPAAHPREIREPIRVFLT